jgi:RNA polymerase sigma-70 factor, ECF subfamily
MMRQYSSLAIFPRQDIDRCVYDNGHYSAYSSGRRTHLTTTLHPAQLNINRKAIGFLFSVMELSAHPLRDFFVECIEGAIVLTDQRIIISIATINMLTDTSSQLAASAIDPKLVARVTQGEHHALSQLYDQSSTVLFSLALRILGNVEEAADVLHEIYLDVWRKIVRYDVSRGTPIAWLITLTRSRAIDRVRARGPRTPHQMGPSIDEVQTDQVSGECSGFFDSQADQELRNLVKEAWGNLSRIQQQAVELAYYEGLPKTEIAAQLGQPVESVKTCIARGMSQLHESLQSYWEQEEAV